MNKMIFIFLFLGVVFTRCSVDRLSMVAFQVQNQYDREVKITFRDYSEPGKSIKDTVFAVPAGATEVVYFLDGLVLDKDTYIDTDRLRFSTAVQITSDQNVSSKNLLLLKEWKYNRRNNYEEFYTVTISGSDFNP